MIALTFLHRISGKGFPGWILPLGFLQPFGFLCRCPAGFGDLSAATQGQRTVRDVLGDTAGGGDVGAVADFEGCNQDRV